MNEKIRIIRGHEINADLTTAWLALHQKNPSISSPYFHPEFTKAVATVRSDVFVAIFERDDEPVAFFPFQRDRNWHGRPVGGRLSDFHGVIADEQFTFDGAELLKACDLRSYRFDHLVVNQSGFSDSYVKTEESWYIDLSNGYDAYFQGLKKAGSSDAKNAPRKLRKLEREVGPIEFRLCNADAGNLDQLLIWKSEQYQRTGLTDVFAFQWTRDLLRHLVDRGCNLCGCFTSLYAGDHLVAAHFGLRSGPVLHYWFPAYDPEFGKYSPGTQLLLEGARHGAEQGITRIDLGKGDERYKLTYGTDAVMVAEGVIRTSRFAEQTSRMIDNTKNWLKASPYGAPARQAAKLLRPFRERKAFQ
ncbi:GNAT family N-acetyltransferase [Calycomorphotria hydatis]|uniref:BioF2-like acetyltransferase domain-containing protein n=1 Tax=Calycomorphotria hydatis TaxID=2528027 RepID=A0A517TCS2_9PLAN|nr:GNAT family N-acetyltransferase [Calycomorphotria hydatis]QDT66167.1 hypothetical protein V22_34320 [Calycomorphotria hydatis]